MKLLLYLAALTIGWPQTRLPIPDTITYLEEQTHVIKFTVAPAPFQGTNWATALTTVKDPAHKPIGDVKVYRNDRELTAPYDFQIRRSKKAIIFSLPEAPRCGDVFKFRYFIMLRVPYQWRAGFWEV